MKLLFLFGKIFKMSNKNSNKAIIGSLLAGVALGSLLSSETGRKALKKVTNKSIDVIKDSKELCFKFKNELKKESSLIEKPEKEIVISKEFPIE